MIGGHVFRNDRGGDEQVLFQGNAFGSGPPLHGSNGTNALEIDSATTASQAPVVRRFERQVGGRRQPTC